MSKVNVELTSQEVIALEQTLKFCEEQEGLSHKGYFGSAGWAGSQMQSILDKVKAADEAKWRQQPLTAFVSCKFRMPAKAA